MATSALRLERVRVAPGEPRRHSQSRCKGSSRGLLRASRCLGLCLEFCLGICLELSLKLSHKTLLQHERVGQELASPADEPHRLIRVPNGIRSSHPSHDSTASIDREQLLQHLVHFEGRVKIAQIASHLEQTQPDAGHLRIPGETCKPLSASKVRLVGPEQSLMSLKLPQ